MHSEQDNQCGTDETEARFQRTTRTLRLPFVRIYNALFMLIALAYSVINPQFLGADENAWLAILLGMSLILSATHMGSTFLRIYPQHAAIDFTLLLCQTIVVTQINLVLFAHLIEINESMHAVGVINRLSITAFAAVALAGRQRLFLGWMALDFMVFSGFVVPVQGTGAGLWYALLSYASGAAIMVAINLAIDRSSRKAFAMAEALEVERARNEAMVHNMLPAAAVERIRNGQLVADSYADASIVFIDMVGFSALSKRVSPGHLVDVLNAFFVHADRCAVEVGVEKVKTIGDAYLAVAGANIACRNSADVAIAFARAVLAGREAIEAEHGVKIGFRVGIHSGPVVGGVIGASRMAYDFWGDTVNVAARLQAAAPVDGLAISESTWLRTGLRAQFGPPRQQSLKGIGKLCIYTWMAGPDRIAEAGGAVPAIAKVA